MKRRSFFAFLGGTAVAGPAAARAAWQDSVLKQAGIPSDAISAAPMSFEPPSSGAVSKIIRWVRRSGIPAWKMDELKRRADHQRSCGLDPDLATLVSCSPGWKARKQRGRNLDREIEVSLSSIGKDRARRDFFNSVQKKFGEQLDWYD